MSDKTAVSQQWVAGKVNAAKNVTGGRLDRFFGGMADTAARASNKAQASTMMGMAGRGASLNRVADKAMTAAEAASYHPKFPMGKLSSAKEAGIKDVLMQEIPGTKPWLIGRPGLTEAASTVSKIKRPMAGGQMANGAWDVSAMAKQMGLHNRKVASAFGKTLEQVIQSKLAGRVGDFIEGAKHEAGPAAGATLGAGLAKAYGVDPLAGAAAGYGLGAAPEIYHGIKQKMLATAAAKSQLKRAL